MITKPFVGVLFGVCAWAVPLVGSAATVTCLEVQEGWARLPPTASTPMTAGYGKIRNGCGKAITVVGARSAAFADVSLHETRVQGDVSRMQHLHHLAIPAGATIELKPGGMHLMLMQATGAVKEGQSVPVVLALDGGDEASISLQVRKTAP